MIEVLEPEAIEATETKQPQLWCGLAGFKGEYWWPGYARRPLENGASWHLPDDVQRGSVIGETYDVPVGRLGPYDWSIIAIGILYFNPDGSPTGDGAKFGQLRELAPGDSIAIHSLRRRA